MNRVRQGMLAGLLCLALSGAASAVPITFQLDNVTITGAALDAQIDVSGCGLLPRRRPA
jgi:hypothetical protein